MTLRVKYPRAAVLAACAVLACLIPVGVSAQNPGIQELLNRVDRLQRELTALQRHVYQGKTAPAAASQPSSAVPADPRMAARHSVRITQLENEISRLTGRMEEIDFALSKIEARLDKLVVDLDQRLTALEGGDGAHRRCGNAPARIGAAQCEPDLRPLPERAPALTRPRLRPRLFRRLRVLFPLSPAFWVQSRRISLSRSPVGRKQCRALDPPARPADVPTASVALRPRHLRCPPGRQNHNTTTRYR